MSFLKMATNSNTFFPSFMTTFPLSSLFHLLIKSTHIKLVRLCQKFRKLLVWKMHRDAINTCPHIYQWNLSKCTGASKKTINFYPQHGLDTKGIKIICHNHLLITHTMKFIILLYIQKTIQKMCQTNIFI